MSSGDRCRPPPVAVGGTRTFRLTTAAMLSSKSCPTIGLGHEARIDNAAQLLARGPQPQQWPIGCVSPLALSPTNTYLTVGIQSSPCTPAFSAIRAINSNEQYTAVSTYAYPLPSPQTAASTIQHASGGWSTFLPSVMSSPADCCVPNQSLLPRTPLQLHTPSHPHTPLQPFLPVQPGTVMQQTHTPSQPQSQPQTQPPTASQSVTHPYTPRQQPTTTTQHTSIPGFPATVSTVVIDLNTFPEALDECPRLRPGVNILLCGTKSLIAQAHGYKPLQFSGCPRRIVCH